MSRSRGRSIACWARVGLALAGFVCSIASAEDDVRAINVAVYGDAPYGTTPTDTAEFQATPAFIESVNADPGVSLVVHVGDIHSGKQYCTQSYDLSIYNLWTQFQRPLVYTPGDNEWTDCHKSGEGGGTYNKTTGQIDYVLDANGNPVDYAKGDPIANLALIRSIFFSEPGWTLGKRVPVLSQAFAYDRRFPDDATFVENVMWLEGHVLFVTINAPGGSNNDQDVWYKAPSATPAQLAESPTRTAANIHWLDTAFTVAKFFRLDGVVIVTQADMWDLDNTAAGAPGQAAPHLTGYESLIKEIATKTLDFKKPVLLFNGDSHVYRSDNPLMQGAACVIEPSSGQPAVPCDVANDDWLQHPFYDVPNFHRVVVHGSTFPLEWLKLTIDSRAKAPNGPTSFGPFSWQRMTQPAP
jgi:Calcineurin-like phosphoesterase